MSDWLDSVRAANPVPRPEPFEPDARRRMKAGILATEPAKAPGGGALARALRRAQRGRLVVAVGGVLLLAGGTAAALGILNGTPSSPPSGKLTVPGGDARGAANGYAVSVTPNLQGGGAGWCVATSLYSEPGGGGGFGCGYAPLPGQPIVAVAGGSGSARAGDVYSATTEYVYLTTQQVAAVRVSPTLTLLTRTDSQLPDHYRVAIDIQQTIAHHPLGTPPPDQPQPAVALNRAGRQIGLPATDSTEPQDPAVFWSSAHTHTPPAGACEIDLNGLHGAFGFVVRYARGFPELTDRAFLSCASTQTGNGHGLGAVAAILLDAQHPGNKPAPLPDAKPVPGHPQTFNEPGIPAPAEPQTIPPQGRPIERRHPLHRPRPTSTSPTRLTSTSITGRRIGNAWLVVQAGGTLSQRLAILDRLQACVRLTEPPCPGPS